MTYAFRNPREIDRPHQTTQRNPFASRNLRGTLFGNEPLGARHHHNDVPNGRGQTGKSNSLDMTAQIKEHLRQGFALLEIMSRAEQTKGQKGILPAIMTPEEYVVIQRDGELKAKAFELMKLGVEFFFNTLDQETFVMAVGKKTPEGPVLSVFMQDGPKPVPVEAIENLGKLEFGAVAIADFSKPVAELITESDTLRSAGQTGEPQKQELRLALADLYRSLPPLLDEIKRGVNSPGSNELVIDAAEYEALQTDSRLRGFALELISLGVKFYFNSHDPNPGGAIAAEVRFPSGSEPVIESLAQSGPVVPLEKYFGLNTRASGAVEITDFTRPVADLIVESDANRTNGGKAKKQE